MPETFTPVVFWEEHIIPIKMPGYTAAGMSLLWPAPAARGLTGAAARALPQALAAATSGPSPTFGWPLPCTLCSLFLRARTLRARTPFAIIVLRLLCQRMPRLTRLRGSSETASAAAAFRRHCSSFQVSATTAASDSQCQPAIMYSLRAPCAAPSRAAFSPSPPRMSAVIREAPGALAARVSAAPSALHLPALTTAVVGGFSPTRLHTSHTCSNHDEGCRVRYRAAAAGCGQRRGRQVREG